MLVGCSSSIYVTDTGHIVHPDGLSLTYASLGTNNKTYFFSTQAHFYSASVGLTLGYY